MTEGKTAAIQISRKGMFIWIGLIIFISFWMFVLGVMVGRGMAPVNLETGKLEKELAELKAKTLNREQENTDAQAAGKAGEKPQLGFYEALKDPGKETAFKIAKPVEIQTPKPLPAPPAAVSKPEPTAPVAPVPAPQPKREPPPAPAPKTVNRPQPQDAPVGEYFSVQVASVQDIKGADKLVAELRNKGYQAYQIRSEVAGKGVWYRIRVGGFEDRGAAGKILKKLKGDKYGGMVVRTK
jgi:cell division septation protein DedD